MTGDDDIDWYALSNGLSTVMPDGTLINGDFDMEAQTPVTDVIDSIKPHEPGIYFDMPEDVYHADPSLGSSNERKLAKNPADYWFDSWMNPNRPPEKETPSTIRGTAVHVLALYGADEFDKRYMRGPDQDAMTSSEKAQSTKRFNEKAAATGKIGLPALVYDNVAIASAMIAKNPKLANALIGGMNEVSVFWRVGTVPKKARIDVLKPRGVGDLKSVANQYGKAFKRACIDNFTNYRYDVQAKHYLEARALIPQFVADGCVHGDHDAALLKAVCKAKEFAWQFVFWQAEGAPITHSLILSPRNPILELAEATLRKADTNYVDYMQRFGPHEMWLPQEDPEELLIEDLPPWHARD